MVETADLILVILLGAGVWSSIQLHIQGIPRSLRSIAYTSLSEGGMVGAVWLLVTASIERQISAALLPSLLAGGIWAGFTLIARGAYTVQTDTTA